MSDDPEEVRSWYALDDLLDLQLEHELTDVEMLRVLTEAQQQILKYMLRAERHPDDPDCKADEESEERQA